MTEPMNLDHGTAAIILQAAEEQFGLFGYTKVTMEEIASAAGLGKASLYYYYSTKEELFRAVLNKKFGEFEVQVGKILGSDEPVSGRIHEYVEQRHQFFNQLLTLHIPDFRSVPRNQPLLKEFFTQSAAHELRWLTQLFSEKDPHRPFNLRSPQETALTFLHVMQGLRLRYLRSEDPRPGERDTSDLKRELALVTDIFLCGIAGTGTDRSGPSEIHRQE